MRAVEVSSFSGPDLSNRQDICSSHAFASAMTLDMVRSCVPTPRVCVCVCASCRPAALPPAFYPPHVFVSCVQIIVSCIFAVMESFCPSDAGPDESFQYTIDTTSFRLPKVRFQYDVSPPPPPPTSLAAYEMLVATDPAGFQMARGYLEDIFPRLSDVATSSVGASVGEYIADFTVTPEQLTKAYLSSHGMTKDGIGARVVESKHTGRWRPACKMLWRLFDDRMKASAGTLSRASIDGNPHFDDVTHQSMYDRNMMLYAMIEIKMSLDKDSLSNIEFSTLDMYDTICGIGVGGYRVPVGESEYDTYSFQNGFELDSFSPVVGYGSLETMQSSYLGYATACRQDFAREDVAMQLFCGGIGPSGEGQGTEMRLDAMQRQAYAPFIIQRDRLCNASQDISIEEMLARPPEFTTSLYDTPYRSKFAIDKLLVSPYYRGEEKLTLQRYTLNLRSFVYITSSSNPSVRPGMHRLLDLPVFDDSSCAELPGVDCAPRTSPPAILNPGDAYMASFEASQLHWTGRQMMRRIRCSSYIDAAFTLGLDGGSECMTNPYSRANDTRCYTGNLNLQSRPQLYSSQQWIRTLVAPPPSPPPFSPSPPPPSPTPPHPQPPPSPPYIQPQSELMAAIRAIEEQACTSVYYLTAATRCDRLAVGLTQSVLYEKTALPSPPPGQPIQLSPPPPSPPPVPSLPAGIFNSPILGSRMSTMRVPTNSSSSSRRDVDLYSDGYSANSMQLASMMEVLTRAALADQMAQCSDWQQSAPLPCVSGAFANNCISGMRHCGTDAENSEAPFVDLSLVSVPAARHNRLWAVQIDLPSNAELADLFYHSADAVGGSGYVVDVYRADGSAIACMPQADQTEAAELNSERKITHLCAGGAATDAEIYALDQAHRVRIALVGSYRQLWIKNIVVLEIASANDELELRPPEPPPLPVIPPAPPTPPAVPVGACTFAPREFYIQRTVVRKEPCGLTVDECCYHTRAAFPYANAFELSDTGCCLLVYLVPGASAVVAVRDTPMWGFLGSNAGTGRVDV